MVPLSDRDDEAPRRLPTRRVAVAVPCFDEEARIPALLAALRTLDPAPGVGLALDDGSADPDYYTASADGSALPVAVADDVAWSFQGLLRALRGSLVPVVYLDKIERMPAGTTTQLITGRRRMIAAELTQAGQVDHVQGDEGVDEVVRVASVIGREIDIAD